MRYNITNIGSTLFGSAKIVSTRGSRTTYEGATMATVLGVGGVFFKAEDPEKLGEWYRKWLGVPVEAPYGANFMPDSMPKAGLTVWAPFSATTDYFVPSKKPFMFNLIADDLEGALEQVKEGGPRSSARF